MRVNSRHLHTPRTRRWRTILYFTIGAAALSLVCSACTPSSGHSDARGVRGPQAASNGQPGRQAPDRGKPTNKLPTDTEPSSPTADTSTSDAAPSAEPSTPAADPSAPAADPSAPTADPSAPAAKPSSPAAPTAGKSTPPAASGSISAAGPPAPSVITSSKTAWPDSSNTGVPAGTNLTTYSGPLTITAPGTIIDSKIITGDLAIKAANVTIKNSKIIGSVATDEDSTGYSFTIADSSVDVGAKGGTGVGAVNFTMTGVQVTGGNRSVNCWHDCLIQDSYVHGQFTDNSGVMHESGIRMGQNTTIRHNTITCDAPDVPPDAGCSAGLTGYGDFGPVQNNVIDNNLFNTTTGGYCAYGGSSPGKPYSSGTKNVVFTNNVFVRGSNGKCGKYGPITSFDSSLPGNVWTGNVWSDGGVVPPAN